jgi:hypothetical protein
VQDSKREVRVRKSVLFGLLAVLVISGPSIAAGGSSPQESTQTKHITVFVEGDTSDIPKFINVAQEKGPERNLRFDFVRDKDADWDIRVVLSAEGSSLWSYAHGNIVVMDRKSNVMFTVTRSDRWTGKGATSALTKEFVKMLSRYYGLSN